LLNLFKNKLDGLEIIPSAGGVFEIRLGDELIFSKKESNRYPDQWEVEKIIAQKFKE